ncbi:MAG: hypothetical protein QM796_15650 [Chthoniobacteraceae bacterium]
MSTPSKFRKWEAIATGLVFLVAIMVPLVLQLTMPQREIARSEGRKLTAFPKLKKMKWKFIKDFPEKFEKYYNDQFGGRNDLLAASATLKVKVFQTSPTKDVMIGKNGWLYYTGEGALDDHLGVTRFTGEQLLAWKEYLERRQAWLAKRNIRYVFVFAPDKQTVYPEFLPDRAAKFREGTAMDQLVAYLRQNCSVPVLDLRPTLVEAKRLGQLYWKTDTHWMFLGEYVGYERLTAELRTMYPMLNDSPYFYAKHPERIQQETDLRRIMRLPGTPLEGVPASNYTYDGRPQEVPLYQADNLRADKQTYSVEPPHPEVPLRVLVYHDSFFNGLIKYFCPHFAKSTYVWRTVSSPQKCEQEIARVMERDQPQLFVEEMLERYANTAPDPRYVFQGTAEDIAVLQAKPDSGNAH